MLIVRQVGNNFNQAAAFQLPKTRRLLEMTNTKDGARHLIRCAHLFDAVLARIAEDKWDEPTCCDGWTVKDCASHAIGVMVNLRKRALGEEPVDYQDGSWAGDNPLISCRERLDELIEAIQDADLDMQFNSPIFGDLILGEFYGMMAYDLLVHAWDLADAVGIDHGIDEVTAELAVEKSGHLTSLVRSEDYEFDPACGDSVLNRLIESTGRTPVNGW